jgi:RNA polymerase sigma-70 factor, ECF subfamily
METGQTKYSEPPRDKDEFHREMVKFIPKLKSFAYHLCNDATMADDLIQSGFERALQRSHHFIAGTRLDSWLYRIIYTQWMDKLRLRKRRASLLERLRDFENTCTSIRNENRKPEGIRIDIQRALSQLSPEHRAAISLITIAGFSYEEAASILDLPTGTVASRVARARRLMANFLMSQEKSKKMTPELKVLP